jgi:hypothetical protein
MSALSPFVPLDAASVLSGIDCGVFVSSIP